MIHPRSQRRPKVKLILNPYEKSLEILAILLLIVYWSLIIVTYLAGSNNLSLFSLNLSAAGYKNIREVLVLPITATVFYFIISLFGSVPQYLNYLTKITQENAESEYRKAGNIMRYLKISVVVVYFFLSLLPFVNSAEGRLGLVILTSIPFLSLLPVIRYFTK